MCVHAGPHSSSQFDPGPDLSTTSASLFSHVNSAAAAQRMMGLSAMEELTEAVQRDGATQQHTLPLPIMSNTSTGPISVHAGMRGGA